MGSIGFGEMLLVLVVAILVYGKDLPRIARKVGRWYANLKRQMTDIKDEIVRQIPDEEELTTPAPPEPPPTPAPPPAGTFDPARPPADPAPPKEPVQP